MECCTDGCLSVRFSDLHEGILDLIHSGLAGYLSDQRRPLIVPNFLRLRRMEATMLFGIFNAEESFLYSFPDLYFDIIWLHGATDKPVFFYFCFVIVEYCV